MNRNRERRSFTVAAKSSGHQGFVSIPAKAPRVPQAVVRTPPSPSPWAAAPTAPSSASADAEPRRILPNLIAWEAPAPEPEPEFVSEPPLPRVRRVMPQGVGEDAPRRRGRPRKIPLAVEAPTPEPRKPEPAAVSAAPRAEPPPVDPAPRPAQRRDRSDGQGLRLGERWKRRLPRSCW